MQTVVDHENIVLVCHVGIHVDVSSMIISSVLRPSALVFSF